MRFRAAITLFVIAGFSICAGAQTLPHSGDYQEPRGEFSLTELLRIIQVYNLGGYDCTGEGEDGFTPGGTPCVGPFHDGDYAPADGRISLFEVLRLIQFYNAGAYSKICEGSEDGFLPVAGSLEPCPGEAEFEGEGVLEGEPDVDGEGTPEGQPEGIAEGAGEGLVEGTVEGAAEGILEGGTEGITEGVSEGSPEGVQEGTGEGAAEGGLEGSTEGVEEGIAEGLAEGSPLEGEGSPEGISEGSTEGVAEGEGANEGISEGSLEGVLEGAAEGVVDGEGALEGIVEGSTEGTLEGEGASEGLVEGSVEGSVEGTIEGSTEGTVEGEGVAEGIQEGIVEGVLEGEGQLEPEAGPFAVASRTLTFTDPSRSNRSIPTTIYYPGTAAGTNQPIAGNEANRFPVLVFAHGFSIGIGFYNYIWNGLVPDGYIVVMCDTENGSIFPPPDHGAFGRDLAYLVDAMQAEGANPASFFHNRVASRSAVAGHSMGGGATMLSVQHSANITTIVPIAAADTNPSAISAAPGISIPALVIGGEKDCVAAPASNVRPMYDGLASACRHYALIDAGSHCQFAVDSTICNLGQIICAGQTFVDANTQRNATIALLHGWLDVQLKQEATAGDFAALLAAEDAANRVTYESGCP